MRKRDWQVEDKIWELEGRVWEPSSGIEKRTLSFGIVQQAIGGGGGSSVDGKCSSKRLAFTNETTTILVLCLGFFLPASNWGGVAAIHREGRQGKLAGRSIFRHVDRLWVQ